MVEPVWTANGAYVWVYASDAAGEPISNIPLYEYCYFQDLSLYSALNWVQRPGLGNPIRNLESEDEWDLYTLQVGHFYLNRNLELDVTNVFNRNTYLYLEFFLWGEGQKVDENHALKAARAANWRITAQDNQTLQGEAIFVAPIYEPSGVSIRFV